MITVDDVRRAAGVLDGVVHRTPLIASRTLGEHISLKAENLQRSGSFKFRGAYNKVSSLPPGTPLVAFSSGNHAQAVALAARLIGSPATILMPDDAPASKLAATRAYGAEVVTYDRYAGDREAIGAELAAARGAELVRPYDDELIMAGAGTAALELIEDAGGVDTLVVPVGGGGLISGSATAAKAAGSAARRSVSSRRPATTGCGRSRPGTRWRSTCRGRSPTACRRRAPGALTWEVASRLVDEIVTVTDAQIVEAMRFAFERLKLAIEPSGAVGLAAVRANLVTGGRIGVIVSGGNVDASRFSELLGA